MSSFYPERKKSPNKKANAYDPENVNPYVFTSDGQKFLGDGRIQGYSLYCKAEDKDFIIDADESDPPMIRNAIIFLAGYPSSCKEMGCVIKPVDLAPLAEKLVLKNMKNATTYAKSNMTPISAAASKIVEFAAISPERSGFGCTSLFDERGELDRVHVSPSGNLIEFDKKTGQHGDELSDENSGPEGSNGNNRGSSSSNRLSGKNYVLKKTLSRGSSNSNSAFSSPAESPFSPTDEHLNSMNTPSSSSSSTIPPQNAVNRRGVLTDENGFVIEKKSTIEKNAFMPENRKKYSFAHASRDLLEFLQRMNVRNCYIIGLSAGGPFALAAAEWILTHNKSKKLNLHGVLSVNGIAAGCSRPKDLGEWAEELEINKPLENTGNGQKLLLFNRIVHPRVGAFMLKMGLKFGLGKIKAKVEALVEECKKDGIDCPSGEELEDKIPELKNLFAENEMDHKFVLSSRGRYSGAENVLMFVDNVLSSQDQGWFSSWRASSEEIKLLGNGGKEFDKSLKRLAYFMHKQETNLRDMIEEAAIESTDRHINDLLDNKFRIAIFGAESDCNVPHTHAQFLGKRLPHASVKISEEGEHGHISVLGDEGFWKWVGKELCGMNRWEKPEFLDLGDGEGKSK